MGTSTKVGSSDLMSKKKKLGKKRAKELVKKLLKKLKKSENEPRVLDGAELQKSIQSYQTILRPGFFLDIYGKSNTEGAVLHTFCGEHDIPGAICPNCKKPLLRFLSIDTSDPKLGLRIAIPYIHLLYCWKCNVAQAPFFYLIENNGNIKLLEYGRDAEGDDFPYDNYPVCFPEYLAPLVEMPAEIQQIICVLNRNEWEPPVVTFLDQELDEPNHQVGGEPHREQFDIDFVVNCPLCSCAMPFLANIGDKCLDLRGFTDNTYVQTLYYFCKDCYVLYLQSECD